MGKIIGGCVCWLLMGVAFAGFALYVLTNFTQPQQQFKAPGRIVLQIDTAHAAAKPDSNAPTGGKALALWYDYKTVFDGKSYAGAPKVPQGLQVKIVRAGGAKDAAEIAVSFAPVAPSDLMVQKVDGSERLKAGSFLLPPGVFSLTVSGIEPEMIFSVGADGTTSLTGSVFVLMAVGGAFGMLGLVLIILGYLQRKKRKAAELQ